MVEANPGDADGVARADPDPLRQERSEEGLALLEGALQADEPPVDLYPLAAQVHASLGNEAEAEAALRTFVTRSESAAAYLPLVNFHSAREDAEATMRVLDEAVARYPQEPMLWLLRTEALLAQERSDDARRDFRRFREPPSKEIPR